MIAEKLSVIQVLEIPLRTNVKPVVPFQLWEGMLQNSRLCGTIPCYLHF